MKGRGARPVGPTLAPIWLPHWPAWMWTISLMLRGSAARLRAGRLAGGGRWAAAAARAAEEAAAAGGGFYERPTLRPARPADVTASRAANQEAPPPRLRQPCSISTSGSLHPPAGSPPAPQPRAHKGCRTGRRRRAWRTGAGRPLPRGAPDSWPPGGRPIFSPALRRTLPGGPDAAAGQRSGPPARPAQHPTSPLGSPSPKPPPARETATDFPDGFPQRRPPPGRPASP